MNLQFSVQQSVPASAQLGHGIESSAGSFPAGPAASNFRVLWVDRRGLELENLTVGPFYAFHGPPSMISSYNLKESLLAVLCTLGSVIGYGFAYLFFRFAFGFVTTASGYGWLRHLDGVFAAVVLVVVTLSGYWTWRSRGGFYGYHESALYYRYSGESFTGFETSIRVHRVTGPAYLLSQIFLAGPLLGFQSVAHLKNRIPESPGLESNLEHALQTLRRANKWQSLEEYPELRPEILLLARMRKIDFSAAKGTPRIKASLPPESRDL